MEGRCPALPLLLLVVASIGFSVAASDQRGPSFRVEPDVETVPANHLKFYLHFPEPMERGEVFRHLRLVEIDARGEEIAEVPEPFREVELWDETFTRMTLWFHPGRQKPGVNLNVEIGPILEEGKRYRLEVSREWKTETGNSLKGRLAREFNAGPFDDQQPDLAAWGNGYGIDREGHIFAFVTTGETLDPESARKRVRILVGDRPVAFSIRGGRISFRGSQSGPASFTVVVDPRLEDLAGNSVARPFNLDLEANPDFEERTEPIELEFPRKIKPPSDSDFPGKARERE
jgi:hypothetical protein